VPREALQLARELTQFTVSSVRLENCERRGQRAFCDNGVSDLVRASVTGLQFFFLFPDYYRCVAFFVWLVFCFSKNQSACNLVNL